MYSDTLNPKHKETHKKEFGFILSLREALCCGLEEGEKSAQQTREALCTYPHDFECDFASRILCSKLFDCASEYNTERERDSSRRFERERCRIVPHYPFVIVIVKATPRTPHHHRWSFEIEAEEDEKERSW